MKLSTWIEKTGGYSKAAQKLEILRPRVYAWRNGANLPRPDVMKKIVKITNGKVSYKEMIDEHLEFAAAKKTASKKTKKKKTAKAKTTKKKTAKVKKKKETLDAGF